MKTSMLPSRSFVLSTSLSLFHSLSPLLCLPLALVLTHTHTFAVTLSLSHPSPNLNSPK